MFHSLFYYFFVLFSSSFTSSPYFSYASVNFTVSCDVLMAVTVKGVVSWDEMREYGGYLPPSYCITL
jgi:hypothetical protein